MYQVGAQIPLWFWWMIGGGLVAVYVFVRFFVHEKR